mmetsp:Transcript_51982/g.123757  ORF Transcript_51982/g.123757 Transcript_51982/m.123757 type:complete len:253 (-) Transcript_51982:20-778(-)
MSVIASESHAKVANTAAALSRVEGRLSGLLRLRSSEVLRHLSPLESAEFQVTMVYAVASIYYCHLLAQGFDPKDHPIRQELERIQLYFNKVRTTVTDVAARDQEKERLRVDTDVANRMLRHYVAAAEAANQRQRQAATSAPGVSPPSAREVDVQQELSGSAIDPSLVGESLALPGSKRRRRRSLASDQLPTGMKAVVEAAAAAASDSKASQPKRAQQVAAAAAAEVLSNVPSAVAEVGEASPSKRKRKRKST